MSDVWEIKPKHADRRYDVDRMTWAAVGEYNAPPGLLLSLGDGSAMPLSLGQLWAVLSTLPSGRWAAEAVPLLIQQAKEARDADPA